MAQIKDLPAPKIFRPPSPNVTEKKPPIDKGMFTSNVRAALQGNWQPATSLALGNVPPEVARDLTPQALAQVRGLPVTVTPNLGYAAAYQTANLTTGAGPSILVSPEAVAGKKGDYTRLMTHEYNHAFDVINRSTNLGIYPGVPAVTKFDLSYPGAIPTNLSGFGNPVAGRRGAVGYASSSRPSEAYAEIGAVPSQIPRSLMSFYPQFQPSAFGTKPGQTGFAPAPVRQPTGQRNAFGSTANPYSIPAFKKVRR